MPRAGITRARGGAAVRPGPGAAAVSGGVKKGKLATRGVRDAEARDAEHDAALSPKRKCCIFYYW